MELTASKAISTNICIAAAAHTDAPPRTMPTNAPGIVTSPTDFV